MIRLLICDDSEPFRTVLRATLAEQPEISVVGEAGDGQEAVDLALALSPDAILMDVRMPFLDGIEATREITTALPAVRIVGLTGFDDREVTAAMLEAGAATCCVKGSTLWELERAIAGAAEPLVRLAHSLKTSASTPGVAELVARETSELTGGAATAVYLAAPDAGRTPAAAAGPALGACPISAPDVVVEAVRRRELTVASDAELVQLAAVGFPCRQALAAPLLADGQPAGALLVATPADMELQVDEELVSAIAELAARSVAGERRAAKEEGGDHVAKLPTPHELRSVPEAAPASGLSAGPGDRTPTARVVALPLPRPSRGRPQPRLGPPHPARVLVVDDDERLRILLRTTLEVIDIEIDDADSVPAARASIAERRPDVIVLDLSLPGPGGLVLCGELKAAPSTSDIGIVVLTGTDPGSEATALAAGADAYLRKPFSPLELLAVVERLAGGLYEGPFRMADSRPPGEQLIRYAEDLRRLLELEQGQRALIQRAYRETVGALASALEAKDIGTNAHSRRVQQYAMELAWVVEPRLVEEPSVEYGFLLHDVGKIGIPDRILNKRGALTEAERRTLETHVILGEQMLAGVALLHGGGLDVVRHHHERWDGDGYPDRLGGYDIPLPARIFAVVDALDAITSDRPYRPARGWDEAVVELIAQSGSQFDPDVVEALRQHEPRLQAIHADFAATNPLHALDLPPDEEAP